MPSTDPRLDQARQWLREGQLDQARQVLETMLTSGARSVEAAEMLGQIGMRKGRPDLAARAYALALSYEPRAVRNKLHFAIALNALGHGRDAEVAAREFREAEPGSLPGLFTLATSLRLQGRFDEALALGRDGVERHPEMAETWLALAETEELSGDAGAACATLVRALDRFPRHAGILTERARLADVLGDRAACESTCRDLLAEDPNDGSAHWQLSLARRCVGPDDPDLAAARATVDDPEVAAEHRMEAHYALARMLDQIGEYEQAMAHAREANGLHHQRHSFNSEAHARTVDQVIATPVATSPGTPVPGPLFIIGMPRSGATLLEQMLASHPAIETAGEQGWMQRWARVHRRQAKGPPAADFKARYLEALGIDRAERYTIDRMPTHFLHLDAIAGLFPDAPVVHIRRNALDTCRSCYFTPFRTGHFWSNDLDDLVAFHHHYRRLMEHWRTHPPLPLHELHYEELVREPRPVMEALLAFLGLPWDEACLRHESRQAAIHTVGSFQVREPVHDRAVGRSAPYAGDFPGLDEE